MFPYTEIEFAKSGAIHDQTQVEAALQKILQSGASDVLVMCHGWNNNIPDARGNYMKIMKSLDSVRTSVPTAAGRKIAVIGILWPAIQWGDEIAGGGAGATDEASELGSLIAGRIEDRDAAAELQALVGQLDSSAAARARYLRVLRGLLPTAGVDDDDAPPATFRDPGADADTAFALADTGDALEDAPEAAGGGAGLAPSGFLSGARMLLNTFSYYTMKARAGDVGGRGVASVLEQIHKTAPDARIHLVGHSFGARVCSAAALATRSPVCSVSLLQGAFSHYGFAENWDGAGTDGFFRSVPSRLLGPMIVTHTENDQAVGRAYAIASSLANQVASAIGGPDDVYGGIGRNGALKTPEAAGFDGVLLPVGGKYALSPAHVSNLESDAFISSHGDVTGPEVAYAVLTAMMTAPA